MAKQDNRQSVAAILIAVALGALISWAGSDGSAVAFGLPVFAICGALAYLINGLAFVPSALAKTEHYYDLVGGITYVSVTATAATLSADLDLRAVIVTGMVGIWALRLSLFLFLRISKAGKDDRFDNVKTRPLRFLMAWSIQGLWVLLTAAAALAVITGDVRAPIGLVGIVGIALWSIGITVEIVADRQKSRFRADPENQGKFIAIGLWAWSRHPNYFGEILLWTGMAVIAIPVLQGWQWVTLISPVFVFLLLTRVSGIPLLQKKAEERWGGQDDYEEYKRRTPVLVPRPPSRSR